MFQIFSGSSRRPRQVNLSGQNKNSLTASGWGPSSASGNQKSVVNAQQERLQRKQHRDRENASRQIQRVWRGHKARRELADSRRGIWDEANAILQSSGNAESVLVGQLRLILTFFNRRRRDDIQRLVNLSQNIMSVGPDRFLAVPEIQPRLTQLSTIALYALQGSVSEIPPSLLRLLSATIYRNPQHFPRIAQSYYRFLSAACSYSTISDIEGSMILEAIKAPLVVQFGLENNNVTVLNAYAAFALYFLTTPNLQASLGKLHELATAVDVSLLSAALVQELAVKPGYQTQDESSLWLLAHFIYLNRLQRHYNQDSDFLRALSIQLSNSSSEIAGRIDEADPETLHDGETEKHAIPPLPTFVRVELLSLVDKSSITGLLAKFNIDYAKASAAGEDDASLLASYALTLLRIFPRRSDEIRMWLYLGSMTTSVGGQIPALKFFWQAVSKTNIFSAIRADSKVALSILRPQTTSQITSVSANEMASDLEWQTILLFLELYTFVLRFIDDEEFLGGSTSGFGQSNAPVSRIRESALHLDDVKRLTIFLKNLAFTTYYNAGELSDDGQNVMQGGLGMYFGTASTSRIHFEQPDGDTNCAPKQPFAGVAGMTFDYVRSIVTGVMRMLYERDSRRGFLPKGHWLMTSRFDMEGFITAVVLEEEKQHKTEEDSSEADTDSEEDFGSRDEYALVGTARPRRAIQIEAMRRQQERAKRKKILAAVGPRLEVLQNMPFVIPFETRVQIFRQFVFRDQSRRRNGNVDPDIWRISIMHQPPSPNRRSAHEQLGRHHAKIRRDQIFEDAYDQYYELGESLKEPIQITFVDQFDTVEAGIDGGGVTKEFLTSVTNEAFRGQDGPKWFISNDQNLLYPNPSALDERRGLMRKLNLHESSPEWRDSIREILRRYEFLGRVVGKCLYEGILVDISFAGFFLLKWATFGAAGSESGYRANLNDLRDLDESLYQGLLKLKNYPGNVEDFSLDFTITDTTSLPGEPTEVIIRDLMPNGSNIPVSNENRPLYVSYVARHRLQVQPYQQSQAFLKGLSDIIKPGWLSMFNQSELQTLIAGDSSEINVDDLRENTLYGGVYEIGDDGLEHKTVQIFWQVMRALDDEDRRKVLKYVTSTPRAPLLGFSQLNPRFSIRDAGSDEERLPSTSTCVNLLKLPRYSTEAILKQKLLYAVNSGAGFDLS